jgi:hypothetical protein
MIQLLFTLAFTTALLSKVQDRFESVEIITTKAIWRKCIDSDF